MPNAMRIVDCLVSAGHLPALASDREALAGDMPEPGGSLDTVLAAELALDLRLGNVLASVERELTPCAGAGKVPIEFVSVPLASRDAYQDWLRKRVDGPRDGAEAGGPEDPATLCVDSLFANLMVMIDQTLVHAFVHWHRGEHELADTTLGDEWGGHDARDPQRQRARAASRGATTGPGGGAGRCRCRAAPRGGGDGSHRLGGCRRARDAPGALDAHQPHWRRAAGTVRPHRHLPILGRRLVGLDVREVDRRRDDAIAACARSAELHPSPRRVHKCTGGCSRRSERSTTTALSAACG